MRSMADTGRHRLAGVRFMCCGPVCFQIIKPRLAACPFCCSGVEAGVVQRTDVAGHDRQKEISRRSRGLIGGGGAARRVGAPPLGGAPRSWADFA